MEENELVMAGKFCMKRRVNLESVARALKLMWKTKRNFEVYDMGENKVLFKFKKREDMDRVLLLSPCSFDKYLVILHKLGVGDVASRIHFDKASFWVQIHGLPTMSQTKDAGMHIGSTLGEVEKVDEDGKGFSLGGYLCIRVSLDITKPLCRGRMVRVGGPSVVWVEFKYERLLIFCYWCRKVDHDERDCMMWIRSKEAIKADEKQYGPWLRASQERLRRPQMVMAARNEGVGGKLTVVDSGMRVGAARPLVDKERMNAGGLGEANVDGDMDTRTIHVEGLTMVSTTDRETIPKIMQITNFEEQLRDIDEAIEIGATSKEKTDMKAGSQDNLKNAFSREEDNICMVDGSEYEPSWALGLNPGEHTNKPQNGDYVTLGFSRESSTEAKSFTIGLMSPRPVRAGRMKKD